MSAFLTRIATQFVNTPLALHPGKAEALLHVLGPRIGFSPDYLPEPQDNRFWGASGRDKDGRAHGLYRVVDGVAVVSAVGILVNRGAWVGSYSGEVSYEGVALQIAKVAEDEDVSAVILDLDTPGGAASGVEGLANQIASLNGEKPVVAWVNDLAASAGYYLASQASEIIGTPSAMAGSIGTVIVHFDHSGELAQKGIKPTIIQSAARKMDGHPFGPLDEHSEPYLRGMVEQFNGLFLDAVARGRGPRLTQDAAAALEGHCFIGQEAVARGLLDRIGSFNDAITLARSLADARNRAQPAGGLMSTETNTPGATKPGKESGAANAVDLDAVRADARAEGHKAGYEEGLKAGADAERTRILGIEDVALAGHEALVADMKADGQTTPEQAAMKLLKAEQADGRFAAKAGLMAAEAAAAGVVASPGGSSLSKASTPDEWRAEYEASDKLKAEYPTAESYIATMKREAQS